MATSMQQLRLIADEKQYITEVDIETTRKLREGSCRNFASVSTFDHKMPGPLLFKSVILHNGYEMPSIGLGTFTAKPEDIDLAVTTAVECGYRHIDTAFLYGNETAIGNTLKRLMDDGKVKREELFIVTKLPHTAMTPDAVKVLLRKSLDALQLDYVDMYLVHFPCGCMSTSADDYSFHVDDEGKTKIDPSTDHLAIWKEMEGMVDLSWTRSIGVCNFNVQQIQRLLDVARIKPANLQVECHAYFQQKELFEFCGKNGIAFTAYAPLCSPGFPAFVKDFMGDVVEVPPLLDDPVLKEIALSHGKSVPQILLRWIIERGMIAIPKSINPARIKENFDIFNFELFVTDTKAIDALDRRMRIFDLRFLKGLTSHPEYPF